MICIVGCFISLLLHGILVLISAWRLRMGRIALVFGPGLSAHCSSSVGPLQSHRVCRLVGFPIGSFW